MSAVGSITAALEMGDGVAPRDAYRALHSARRGALWEWDALTKEVVRLGKRAGGLEDRLRTERPRGCRLAELADEIAGLREAIAEAQWRQYEIIATASVGDYTAQDVAGWFARCEEMGVRAPSFRRSWIKELVLVERIPNAGLREAYLAWQRDGERRDDLETLRIRTEEALAAMGVDTCRFNIRGGGTYMRRVLGLAPFLDKRGRKSISMFVSHDNAVAIAAGLQLPTHTFGF